MNVDWNIIHTGGLTISAYVFASVKNLVKGIRETGTADFVVRHHSKTTLDIEISYPGGEDNFKVAHIPPGAEKFKFQKRTIRSIFDGSSHILHHFKLTKTQGFPELKEYLSVVLDNLALDMEELKVNLFLYQMPEFENAS